MKYIFYLLLFSSLCQAQQEFKNYTRVTAYRLVNEDEDGPCNITAYIKRLGRTGHYIQAIQSHNDTLAYNLLQIKKEATEWNKESCDCTAKTIGGAKITNMFIVEVNSYRDTLFTTKNHKSVFFPKEQALYIAPENRIVSAFTKDMGEFHRRDFSTEISNWKYDSIPDRDITITKKPLYGLTKKEFERDITLFQLARTDSVFDPGGKIFNVVTEYWLDNMKFSFNGISDQINEILITRSSSYDFPTTYAINVDGVKVGDSEEMLYCKYDNATLLKYWDAPLNTPYNNYTYEVLLNGYEGRVMYTIRDKIIQVIHIDFNYPGGSGKKKKK